jgi:hypothetical protein
VAGSQQRRYDWVTFTSDYGFDDVFVAVCKGAVAQIAPDVKFIDVCHLVTPHDVQQGATSLAAAAPYLPVAVNLALVDPMSGFSDRGVAVETEDDSLFVGPDNGLLSLAWSHRGGVRRAVEIDKPALWRDTVHSTFRGRDVLAPVAAYLASGTPLEEVGSTVDPDSSATSRSMPRCPTWRPPASCSGTPSSCGAVVARSRCPSPRRTAMFRGVGSRCARTPSTPSWWRSMPATRAGCSGWVGASRS